MVAIKLLRLVDDEEVHERFPQEAQSTERKHENIVTIYDFGEHEAIRRANSSKGSRSPIDPVEKTLVTLVRKLQIAEVLSLASTTRTTGDRPPRRQTRQCDDRT
jgi:hypothetical protein